VGEPGELNSTFASELPATSPRPSTSSPPPSSPTMSMPGSFTASGSDDELNALGASAVMDSESEATSPEWLGIDTDMEDETDDGDFEIGGLEDQGGEEIDLDEEEEEEDDEEGDEGDGPGGQLQIAYDGTSTELGCS
jgi:hypothetical protein